ARGAAELGERDERDVLHPVAQVEAERGQGLSQLAQARGELTAHAAFGRVVVPAADFGEGDLEPDVGLDELRDLPQAVAVPAGRIGGAGGRLVARGVGLLSGMST